MVQPTRVNFPRYAHFAKYYFLAFNKGGTWIKLRETGKSWGEVDHVEGAGHA